MDDSWSLYIVECADGTLYTGIARSVAERIEAHNSGRGAKYTRGRGPVALRMQVDGLTHEGALRREREVKRLDRSQKLELVNSSGAKS